jgi:hypothetical protein
MTRPSRRQVLRASLIAGIAVYLAPLGTRAFAALFEDQLLTRLDWNGHDGRLKYRIDATAKVTGEKVFARDIRARDMPHWPRQQAHALILRVTKADRRYAGFDLSLLGSDLKPDRIVTATDLKRDRLEFPIFYGEDVLLPEGQTPAYLGQAVAILIYQDFARFRFAKEKVQFNDAVVRYGEVTGPLQRDPWGSSRFVRVGGKTAHDEDVFSAMKQGPISPSYDNHEPVWPKPGRDGDVGAQGMYHANRIDDELAHPPYRKRPRLGVGPTPAPAPACCRIRVWCDGSAARPFRWSRRPQARPTCRLRCCSQPSRCCSGSVEKTRRGDPAPDNGWVWSPARVFSRPRHRRSRSAPTARPPARAPKRHPP